MSNVHELHLSNFLLCIVCCLFSTDRLCDIPEIRITFFAAVVALFTLHTKSTQFEFRNRSAIKFDSSFPYVIYHTNVFLKYLPISDSNTNLGHSTWNNCVARESKVFTLFYTLYYVGVHVFMLRSIIVNDDQQDITI